MKKPYSCLFDFCILIPCYNNEDGLIASLGSIVYDPERFCIVIVDDGSSRPVSREAIYKHIPDSYNITILRHSRNEGITRALNNGLRFIHSRLQVTFIARLDCGDICSPERFSRQIDFLRQHQHIDLVGSWCYFTDERAGAAYKYKTPTRHEAIVRSMYFRNVFIHPTVMWRSGSVMGRQYPDQFPHAEDYGMFYDIISKSKSAIIDEYLMSCEITPGGISIKNRKAQLQSRLKVISHFSKNRFLLMLGSLKLWLLLATPYHFVLSTKKVLYKA